MIPEGRARKRRIRRRRIPYEATCRMSVHRQEEGDEQMVSVPESLVALLADLGVGSRIHEQHAQQHDMSGDPAGLCVVDLHC